MKNLFVLTILMLVFSCANSQEENQNLKDGETFLTINDVDHWVKIAGVENNTTPIVVVHGGPGGSNYNFEKTVGPLLEKFATIVYYEQRGCGRSKAPKDTTDYTIPTLISDLDGLREKLGLNKMTLLGFSFGGELSLRYTALHPNRVKQLILSSPVELSTSTYLIQIQGFYSVANSGLRKEIENILMENIPIQNKWFKTWGMVSASVADSFLFNNQSAAKINRQLWQEGNLPNEGVQHFQNVYFKNIKGDLLETANGLETECLIISGIHDKNGGLHYGMYLNKILPHSELKLYENSAHFPDIEESDRYAADIKNFIVEN